MKQLIKPKDQEDVLHMYWVLLGALESRVDGDTSAILDRDTVRAGYTVLNRIGFTKGRPAWENRGQPDATRS